MADEWYYRADDAEHGPFTFSRLQEAARDGRFTAEQAVMQAPGGVWRNAESVQGLLPKTVVIDGSDTSPIADDLSEYELVDWSEDSPADQSKMPADDGWCCRVCGRELGPMRLEDLKLLAREGGLSVNDEVCRNSEHHWQPAGSIPELSAQIPNYSRAASTKQPLAVTEPTRETGTQPVFSEVAPRFDSAVECRKQAVKPIKTPEAIIAPMRRNASAKPKRQRRRLPLPAVRLPRLNLDLRFLGRQICDPKLLVSAAALALVLFAQFFPGFSHDGKHYQTLQGLYAEAQSLNGKHAADAEWRNLERRAAAERKTVLKDIDNARTTSGTPARQALLWVARDHLLPMIESVRAGRNDCEDVKDFQRHLGKAGTILECD